jgi:hypothetical protein
MANALIGMIGGILVVMLSLLISMVWDLKKDLRSQKDCMNLKQDKHECDRIMDKMEKWVSKVEEKA